MEVLLPLLLRASVKRMYHHTQHDSSFKKSFGFKQDSPMLLKLISIQIQEDRGEGDRQTDKRVIDNDRKKKGVSNNVMALFSYGIRKNLFFEASTTPIYKRSIRAKSHRLYQFSWQKTKNIEKSVHKGKYKNQNLL